MKTTAPRISRRLSFCALAAVLSAASVTPILAQETSESMAGMDHDMTAMSGEAEQHDHPALPVDPDLPIPGLSHLVFPDLMDGYNVQILARNFEFTPASINRDNVANEGHAHIYVNGMKVARIYGTWYHLPASALQPGVNAVTVTLNANDHSTWATPDGNLIASTVAVVHPSIEE